MRHAHWCPSCHRETECASLACSVMVAPERGPLGPDELCADCDHPPMESDPPDIINGRVRLGGALDPYRDLR